jgi:hypothetical protein
MGKRPELWGNATVALNYQGGALPLSYNSTSGLMPAIVKDIKYARENQGDANEQDRKQI